VLAFCIGIIANIPATKTVAASIVGITIFLITVKAILVVFKVDGQNG